METFLAGLYSSGSMHIAAVALSGSTRRFQFTPPQTARYTPHVPSTYRHAPQLSILWMEHKNAESGSKWLCS
ncbi:hypothetical protein BJX62DRAFT_220877 [Aspergillus germanicus]